MILDGVGLASIVLSFYASPVSLAFHVCQISSRRRRQTRTGDGSNSHVCGSCVVDYMPYATTAVYLSVTLLVCTAVGVPDFDATLAEE